jgi:hypothetical protein
LAACLFRIAWSGSSRQCIERTIYAAPDFQDMGVNHYDILASCRRG